MMRTAAIDVANLLPRTTHCQPRSRIEIQRSMHPYGYSTSRIRIIMAADQSETESLSELEVEVPEDQRPVNELNQLKTSFLYSWVRVHLLLSHINCTVC